MWVARIRRCPRRSSTCDGLGFGGCVVVWLAGAPLVCVGSCAIVGSSEWSMGLFKLSMAYLNHIQWHLCSFVFDKCRMCAYFRDKADGMRNVFRIDPEGVAGGLGPSRAWSKRDP